MSDPKAQQEPTMEEILSSIRRIISEDQESEGEEGAGEELVAVAEVEAEPDKPVEAVEAEPAEPTQAVEPEAAELAADLDVPEALPEAIDDSAEDVIDDVVVEELQTPEPQEADSGDMEARDEVVAEIDAVASADDEFDESVLDLTEVIDAGEETEVDVPQPAIPEPEIAPEPVPEPPPPPPPPATASLEPAQASHDAGAALNLEAELMSDTPASAAASAFTDLARGVSDAKGVPLGGGNRTLEELVKELIRPMLKDWLDHNLPPLVERLVEREISKLAGRVDDRSY